MLIQDSQNENAFLCTDKIAFNEAWSKLKKVGKKGHERIIVIDEKIITTAAKVSIGKRLIECIKWLFCYGEEDQHERIAKVADINKFFALNQKYFNSENIKGRGFKRVIEYFDNEKIESKIHKAVWKQTVEKVKNIEVKNSELQDQLQKAQEKEASLTQQINDAVAQRQQCLLKIEGYKKQEIQFKDEAVKLENQLKVLESNKSASQLQATKLKITLEKCKERSTEIALDLKSQTTSINALETSIKNLVDSREKLIQQIQSEIKYKNELNVIKGENESLKNDNQKLNESVELARLVSSQENHIKVIKSIQDTVQEVEKNAKKTADEILIKENRDGGIHLQDRENGLQTELKTLEKEKTELGGVHDGYVEEIAKLEEEISKLQNNLYSVNCNLKFFCSDGSLVEGDPSLLRKVPLLATAALTELDGEHVNSPTINLMDLGLQCNAITLKLYFRCLLENEFIEEIKSLKLVIELYMMARHFSCNEEDDLTRRFQMRMEALAQGKEEEFLFYLTRLHVPAECGAIKNVCKWIADNFTIVFNNEKMLKQLPLDYLIEILSQPTINVESESLIWKKLLLWVDIYAKELNINKEELWSRLLKKQQLSDLIHLEDLLPEEIKNFPIHLLRTESDYEAWRSFCVENKNPPKNRLIRATGKTLSAKITQVIPGTMKYQIPMESYLKMPNDRDIECGPLVNIQGSDYQLILSKQRIRPSLVHPGSLFRERFVLLRSMNSYPFVIGIRLGSAQEYYSNGAEYGVIISTNPYTVGVIFGSHEFTVNASGELEIFVRKI